MFLHEIDIMSQMNHPATLSLIGWSPCGNTGGKGLIVMKYMRFGSLDSVNKLVYRNETPEWWNATARSKAVIGMIAGMAYIHELGLLHRDLKPDNIFIDDRYEIRIADFGRARKADVDMSLAPGTVLTQAPETYEGGGYTNKIDVYSFGVTLYMMWAEARTLNDRVDKRPPPAVQMISRIHKGARFVRKDGIPEFYWELITGCWAQAPERRPSFAELLQTFITERGWVFPGTDEDELREYEAKVRRGIRLPSAPSPSLSISRPPQTPPSQPKPIPRPAQPKPVSAPAQDPPSQPRPISAPSQQKPISAPAQDPPNQTTPISQPDPSPPPSKTDQVLHKPLVGDEDSIEQVDINPKPTQSKPCCSCCLLL
jgi:serine/threonine protein kinase